MSIIRAFHSAAGILKKSIILVTYGAMTAPLAEASSGVHFINYYDMILRAFGFQDAHFNHDWQVVLGSALSLIILTLVGTFYRKTVLNMVKNDPQPTGKFGIATFITNILDFVHTVANDVIGDEGKKFFGFLAGIFLFIFFSNIMGLIPGFPPATESLSTNLAMGLSVFCLYNYFGIREHGFGYVKHFLGPIWWLAPLLVVIEIVSHLARPVSLSLRLYGNLFGDHLVLSVFTALTYVVLPSFLLFFGLLVATLQSFVFTLLSSIYISMAISHDH